MVISLETTRDIYARMVSGKLNFFYFGYLYYFSILFLLELTTSLSIGFMLSIYVQVLDHIMLGHLTGVTGTM